MVDIPKSVLQAVVGQVVDLFEDAKDLLTGEDTRQAIIADLGGNPFTGSAPPEFPPTGLDSAKAYRDAAEPDLEGLFAAIQDVRATVSALRAFVESLDLDDGPAAADEGVRALLDILALNVIRLRAPRLYYSLQAFNFAEDFSSIYGGEFGSFSGLLRSLRGLGDFFLNIGDWGSQSNFDSEEGVRRISDRTLFAVAALTAYGLKIPVPKLHLQAPKADDLMYGWDLVPGVPGSEAPTAVDQTLARTLTLKFADTHTGPITGGQPFTGTSLTSIAFVPRTQGGPGLFVSLGGGWEFDGEISAPWHLSSTMRAASAVSFILPLAGDVDFKFNGPAVGSDFRGGLALEARPDPITNKAFDIRFAKGTGISAGLVRFEIGGSEQDFAIKTVVRNGVLSLGKIFDGFLDRLIPADGLRLAVDFAVGLSSKRGRFLEGQVLSIGAAGTPSTAPASLPPPGGAVVPPPLPPLPKPESTGPGVSIGIPIGKSLGPLTIHRVQLRVGAEGSSDDRAYLLEAATSLSTKLGPVQARVDGIGVRLAVRLPEGQSVGNLGFGDLDIGAKPPEGIGLAIDAKGVLTGGGFLFHDRTQQLYAGVMQLTLHERITLKAFGLIATRLPDGSKGYSLLVFITAEDFRPIPIGMACTLQGIGGMVAINRTFSEDAMREGLKNNTLGTLLFPRDPIRNAPEIIRNLATVFPASTGSYMFGVLAKIGWFSPTLVLLELALIFEFGQRKRLIALGRISSMLPSRENALVRLNLDAMGLIDFEEGTVKIDAVLVDSRLAHKFVLTGGMALRARWKGGPGPLFALAVGGLNPRFPLPTGMPVLDRITIALSSGTNPRLTCAAYFAITSNTLQFGARAELYAEAYGFSVHGDVGYDVLIQLAPFHFIADFHASMQLKRGSRNLFKVSLAGELEGPRPLRVAGKASFEILWCDFSVRFDKTLIEGEKPPLPPGVNVLAELKRALSTAESWSTLGAANRQLGVTLRALRPGPLLVLDPLGKLMVKQTVVPLNTTRDVDTFGGAPVDGDRTFKVTATLNGQSQQIAVVKDQFVPAQFFSMTDDEKLASPSFEEMEAGVVFGSDAVVFDELQIVADQLKYESIVIDAAGQSSTSRDKYELSAKRLLDQARFGAVAQAAIRSAGLARFRDVDAPKAATEQTPRWVIASVTDTGTVAPTTSAGATWSETRAAMAALNRAASGGSAQWQLVPVYETVAR